MKQSIVSKLAQLSERLEELNALLSSKHATRDMDSFRHLAREHAEITPVVELYQTYLQTERDIESAQALMSDPEMAELAEAEVAAGRDTLEQLEAELQKHLLPKDPNDERNIFLEIRAGTGGDESALFAADSGCTAVLPNARSGALRSSRKVRPSSGATKRSSQK